MEGSSRLKVTRPVGRIDPNPGVPPEPTTEIALHRGKSLTLVLVGVVLDLPGRHLRTETARAEVVAIAPSISKSPSRFHLTETEEEMNLPFFHQGHLLCH